MCKWDARYVVDAVVVAALFIVIVLFGLEAHAQDIPIAKLTDEGSNWITGPYAKAAAGVGVVGTAIGLGLGEGGGNLRKAGWASLCFTGAVGAAKFVNWFAS